ncbi:MAG TPA: (deoxy)nucleoside triphosphate pyrophosphohydrolase [Vicinamibacterales bacterium]
MHGSGDTRGSLPPAERLVVAAAVIERDNAFLLTRRLKGTHLAGTWEFPGGKCEAGETLEACLQREIREELGAGLVVGDLILTTRHAYPERVVELHFFSGTLDGEPVPQLGQEMRWVSRGELASLPLPEADGELIARLTRAS